MKIRIFVATHKKYWMPDNELYIPIHVGKKIGTADLEYQGDDSGDNISIKNPNYCELTGVYWVWKNYFDSDYIGFVHYRRYFVNKSCLFTPNKRKRSSIFSAEELKSFLKKNSCDIVLPKKRIYFFETIRSHYIHAHNKRDLDEVEKIIKERCPDYYDAYVKVFYKRTSVHLFNMFIIKRVFLEKYCNWLFDILFELEKRIDISDYNAREARVFGFISERLLDVWIEKNDLRYKEVHFAFLERQNWLSKGLLFLKRKFFPRIKRY